MPAIRHVSLWAATIAVCTCVSRASADDELALVWPEIAGCPARAQIVQRIEAQLARPLSSAAKTLRARVQIEHTEHAYVLTLETDRDGERGTRSFAGACGEISEAAALVLALSIDEATPRPSAPVVSEAARPPPQRGRDGDRAEPRYVLRAAALGERGYLPRVGAGVELAFALAFARSELALSASWLAPVKSAAREEGARVELGLWAARAGYCHDLLGRRNTLWACAGLELGRASGAGIDIAASQAKHYLWSAGVVGLRVVGELARSFALYLEPSLAVPFERKRFVSSDALGARAAVLYTPSPVSVRATAGVQVSF